MKLYREIFKLKTILRKGWVVRNACDNVGRYESDAEHTFSMALLAIEIMNKEKLNLDQSKVIKMVLFHELGEIDVGDIIPFDNVPTEEKHNKELACVSRIANACKMPEILELWLEFEENKTPEAQFVRKIDKLDAVMQSKIYSETNENDDLYREFKTSSTPLIKGYEDFAELE